MNSNILDLLQSQFTLERTNSQYYEALAAAADVVNRPGASAYFEKSANDERSHAKRVRDYIIDRGEAPAFSSIEAIPDFDGSDYGAMFTDALGRENITTAALQAFYRAAGDPNQDPQTAAFLISSQGDWPGFLQEQTDSEREITDFLLKINRLGPDGLEAFDEWMEEKYSG